MQEYNSSKMYKVQLEKALSKYSEVPEAEAKKFLDLARLMYIKQDHYFIHEGDKCPWLGFVVKGVFRAFHIDASGAEYTKHFFIENDFMTANSRWLLEKNSAQTESDYYFQALESAVVLCIEHQESGRKLEHSCWQEVFTKEIERVHKIEERRIRQLMLDDAQSRYLAFHKDFPGLEERIKQHHVASYIGISPVSLSRIKAH